MAYKRRVLPLTCTMDGLDHLVGDDAAPAGIAAGLGTYTAICGHTVYAAAMVSPPGRPCPSCRSRHQALAAGAPAPLRHRWVRLARLLRLMRRSLPSMARTSKGERGE